MKVKEESMKVKVEAKEDMLGTESGGDTGRKDSRDKKKRNNLEPGSTGSGE